MEATLDRLRNKINTIKDRAFFSPPATLDDILETEQKLNIVFPASLRQFYLSFNGGFIASDMWSPDELQNAEMYETIQWNSNDILSLEEIKSGFGRRYEDYIPIIHTFSQEFLAIANPLNDNESPVLDAFHEAPPREWGVLYDNFESLLNDYIEREGIIKTMAV